MLTDEEIIDMAANMLPINSDHTIAILRFAKALERAVLAKAGEQEPIASRRKDFMGNYVYRNEAILGNELLYAHPLPAQAIGYASQSEIDSIGKSGHSCLILPEPEFDISVPVFAGSAPVQAIPEGWQPIGTAPKTGRKILLSLLNIAGKRRTIVGFWVEKFSVEDNSDDDQGEEKDGTYYWREGWYESMESHDDFSCLYAAQESITNWMPLPDTSMLSASPKT